MNTNKFPIDYDTLEKGDTIPADIIEHYTGVNRTDRNYGLAVLGFRERIEREMEDRGRPVVTRMNQSENIVVLTDLDADPFIASTFMNTLRKMGRCVRSSLQIDVSGFDKDQKSLHDRRVEIMGKTYQGARKGKREAFKAIAHKRNVPGLPDNTADNSGGNNAPA